jgi:hypothetical protein
MELIYHGNKARLVANFLKKTCFYLCGETFLLCVSGYFNCDEFACVFHVYSTAHLAESAPVKHLIDEEAVPNLLARRDAILADLAISSALGNDLAARMDPHRSNRVNAGKGGEFSLLIWSEF